MYTKAETDTSLNNKANSNDVYTKSETDNKINEPLYNLGHYDTITENSDGTYTITRQTGYVDLGSFDWGVASLNAYNGQCTQMHINLQNNSTDENSFVSNILIPDTNWTPTLYHAKISSNQIFFNIPLQTSIDNAIAYTLNLGIQIQYKLATSYTEKVEKNHYARYNQTFILDHNKSEAERSANLFDDNGTNSIQYIGHYFTNSSYNLTPQNDYNCFRIRVKQNKTYYIKQIGELILRYEDINNNVLGGNTNFYQSGYGSFTTPNGCKYVVFSKAISYTNNVMLNEGTTPLPYQPYEGKVVHEKELESITPGIFTKLGNKTNFSFDSGSYLVVANNGMVTVTGTDPLNGGSANKKFVGIFMVTIAEYGGGQSVCVNTEEVFSGEAASATISGPMFTIYRLN